MNFLYSIWNIFFILLRNIHFRNVFLTFTNVVKLEVENDKVVSTLSNVVHINVETPNVDSKLFDIVNSNVEIYNVVSTISWCCPTSRHRINQKTTLKQRWNVCWHFLLLKLVLPFGFQQQKESFEQKHTVSNRQKMRFH